MSITVQDISELKARTNAGLSDCKKALMEANGDMEKAAQILRQKGLASIAKKAGKIAAEGAVITKINENNTKAAMFELNSQTDFVAKNEHFQNLLNQIADCALNSNIKTLDELKNAKLPNGETLNDLIALKTAQIGEKLDLRRAEFMFAQEGESLGQYTHPIGSKIAVILKLKGKNEAIAKDIAMHIAAYHVQAEFLSKEEIPSEAFENEKQIEMQKEDLVGKPENIKEKIVSGRVEKILLEKVLLEQPSIKNPDKKIKDILKENNLELIEFKRFNLGEGIERKEVSFAEEVAAQMKA